MVGTVLLWNPAHGRASVGLLAKMLQEDLPEAMAVNGVDGERWSHGTPCSQLDDDDDDLSHRFDHNKYYHFESSSVYT